MKIRNMLFAAAALLAAASCSNIDSDERYTYVKPAEVGRCVLIEDFTGQKCVNCPPANDEIEKLQEQYGADTVIAVGIHSGGFGFAGNKKYPVGLMTDTGNEYYYTYRWASQPWGLINRTQNSGTPADWGTLVYNEIQKKAPVSITISNAYDANTRTATIDVSMLGINSVSGKLQVWVIEDGIVAMQYQPNGSITENYVHNHVFRAAVNGTWGEDVSVDEGATVSKLYTLTLDDKWVAENVSIVAFVYNSDGVQQVTKKALTEKAPDENQDTNE